MEPAIEKISPFLGNPFYREQTLKRKWLPPDERPVQSHNAQYVRLTENTPKDGSENFLLAYLAIAIWMGRI